MQKNRLLTFPVRRRILTVLPLLFVSSSRKKPRQVLLYSAAITGGSCRSLTFRLGAPLRSHLPFTLSLPSQPPGILCNDSRACTLFVTVFLFMTIVYRSIYVCICKVCKFYFFRYFFTSSAERFSTSSSGKSSFVSSSLAISNSPISVSKWASLSITTGT